MIVTIDGPAGVGKSSAARTLARRLGFAFLDTGAMYRAIAFAQLKDGVAAEEGPQLNQWLAALHLEAPPGVVRLNGQDIASLLRTPEVTAASSRVAVLPSVRSFLVPLQRRAAEGRNVVCEGRDQGTVVFPHAECKFFLTADPVERAHRRHVQSLARGENTPIEVILAEQNERDRRDAERHCAPMVPAADAILLDSTNLTLDQVVERMETEVRQCVPSLPGSFTNSPTGSFRSS